ASAASWPSHVKTRLHGDYHLGQILLAHNDFVITDFEGEPTRSLAERRQKDSALRDVAGMLRSRHYARFRALSHAIEDRPDALARSWEQVGREAFIDGYRVAAQESGLFPGWGEASGLIELFMLEKAFYELGYEMDHRPDWVRIPLSGIRDLVPGPGDD